MNWKKLGLICTIILLSICLLAPVADAKKKKKKVDKGISASTFQLGADLGANIFGYIPWGDITVDKGGDNEESTSFSGTGGFGPMFGLHGHVMFAGFIVRAEFAYAHQGGTGEYEIDGENLDFEYSLNNVKLGAGIGKTLVKHKVIHPYLIGVIDYHYLTFRNKKEDDSANGSGLGIGAIVGLDAKFMKHWFAGAGIRLDLIYTVNPLTIKDSEVTMGYLPISLFLNGGYLF